MKHTKTGKSMRAVSDNKLLAQISGLSVKKIYSKTFFIGSIIASIAGVLIFIEQGIIPNMGLNFTVKALVCAVIGGMGNVYGAIIGAFFLGFAENIGSWFFGYKDAVAGLMLIIFIMIKHRGNFGKINLLLND